LAKDDCRTCRHAPQFHIRRICLCREWLPFLPPAALPGPAGALAWRQTHKQMILRNRSYLGL
jgi:hypothetical protein